VFSRVSRTSVDIAGSLWSWDGRPPNSRSKYLFSRAFDFLAFADAPTAAPSRGGCRWTALDTGSPALSEASLN